MITGFIEQTDLDLSTICNGDTNRDFCEKIKEAAMNLRMGQKATISIKVVVMKHPNSATMMNVGSDVSLKMPSKSNLSVVSIGENFRLLTDKIEESIDQMSMFITDSTERNKQPQKLIVAGKAIVDPETGQILGNMEE